MLIARIVPGRVGVRKCARDAFQDDKPRARA
jgi:hypothetical protein